MQMTSAPPSPNHRRSKATARIRSRRPVGELSVLAISDWALWA